MDNKDEFLKLVRENYPGIYENVQYALFKGRSYRMADRIEIITDGKNVTAKIKTSAGEEKRYDWQQDLAIISEFRRGKSGEK